MEPRRTVQREGRPHPNQSLGHGFREEDEYEFDHSEQSRVERLEKSQEETQHTLANTQQILARLSAQMELLMQDRRGPRGNREKVIRENQEVENREDSSSSSEEGGYRRRRYEDEFKDVKMELPEYDGSLDPEVLLEWISRCDRCFEVRNYTEEKAFKVAVVKLKGYASLWWENLVKQRDRKGKRQIRTWDKLKHKLKERFLPTTYTQDLYNKVAELKLQSKSVEQYIQEFEKLMMQLDVNERPEQTMSRFVGGLDREIARKLELQTYTTLPELYKLAVKIEKHRKEKKKKQPYKGSYSFLKGGTFYKGNSSKKADSKDKGKRVTANLSLTLGAKGAFMLSVRDMLWTLTNNRT